MIAKSTSVISNPFKWYSKKQATSETGFELEGLQDELVASDSGWPEPVPVRQVSRRPDWRAAHERAVTNVLLAAALANEMAERADGALGEHAGQCSCANLPDP